MPRLHKPSLAELEARGSEGPVILTGCLDDWPLLAALRDAKSPKEKLQKLSDVIGHRKTVYTVVPSENRGHLAHGDDLQPNFTVDSGGRAPFKDFAERLERIVSQGLPETIYMQGQGIRRSFPELSKSLRVLPQLDGASIIPSNLWIGSGNHIVNLHFDLFQNFICLLEGRKRVLLLPPEALPDLYPAPLDRNLGGTPSSLVRLLEPDHARYPKLASALRQARVAEVGPGEVLYIPCFWWHHVESFGLNIMVNTWKLQIERELIFSCMNVMNGSILDFAELPEALRAVCGSLFHYLALKEGCPALPPPAGSAGAVTEEQLGKAVHRIHEAAALFEQLPENWRAMFGVLFDYFAFRAHGEPFPTLPGELDAWLVRKRKKSLLKMLLRVSFVRKLLFPAPTKLRAGGELA